MRPPFLKVSRSLAILLVIAGSMVFVSRSQEKMQAYPTEIIRYPLSTMPAPVLVGQQLRVTIYVAQSAAQWGGVIEGKYNV